MVGFFYKILNLKKKMISYLLYNKKVYKYFFLERFLTNRVYLKVIKFFKKWPKKYLFLYEFYSLKNILLINRFVFNLWDIYFFLDNYFIWKNREHISSKNTLIKINDLVEFNYFKDYFLYNIKINFIYNYKKVKNSLANYYFQYPIKVNYYFINKYFSYISNLYEIDYTTLSIFFINLNYYLLSFKLKFFFLGYNFKYYGWKKLI